MATFAVVIDTAVKSSHDGAKASEVGLETEAARLAETLLGSGEGWYSAVSCPDGTTPDPANLEADAVARFGLGREPCPGAHPKALDLSFEKIQNMNDGKLVADGTNGYVDYPEARASLGLGLNDFHIRSWPVLPALRTLLETGGRDPNERIAYVGAYASIGGSVEHPIVQKTCGITDGATTIDLWVDITNNGTSSAGFQANFTLALQDHDVTIPKHTGLVTPAATARLTTTITKTSDWTWRGTPSFTVQVSDRTQNLGSCTTNLAGVTMTSLTTNRLVVTYAERLENVLSGGTASPKVYYAAYDGKGNPVTYSDWRLEIQDLAGVPVATDTNLDTRGYETFTLALPLEYKAVLKKTLGTILDRDTLNVLLTNIGTFTTNLPATYGPEASVVPETAFLSALVANFSPSTYSPLYTSLSVPYAAGGDIFPDLPAVMNDDLTPLLKDAEGDPSLANYNILILGSGADHNAMTSPSAQQVIRDWVFAGGYLLVLGSDAQTVNWLQPIFDSAISSASSSLVTPDSTHPLLHAPNDLDYASFDDKGHAWHFNNGGAEYFTHIVMRGDDDVLAVSNTGAFGKGRVLLTTYEPWDLLGTGATGSCDPTTLGDTCAALQTLYNFLTFTYRELFIDYGPALPASVPIGVAHRVATVYHPQIGRNVEMVLWIYVF